jgi:hypothetical protein
MFNVAAVNQFGLPDQTDVFVIDDNGALHVSWVDGAGAWKGPGPIGQPGLFPPRAAVAASNQFSLQNQTDVFAVASNGALHVAWVDGAGAWKGPGQIGQPGLLPPGAAVAASNQFGLPDQTDVFAVGANGALYVAWVDGAGAWKGPGQIGQPGLFPPGAAVAASNQFGLPDQTDVFAVGANGALYVAWVDGAGAWKGPAQIGQPGLFRPGAAVAASNQFGLPDQTDVFAVGANGALYVAWVDGAGAWKGPAQIGQPGLFPPGAAVAASNQFGLPDQTDVFAVGANGALYVAWVDGAGAWKGPAQIGQPGLFRPGAAVAASNQFGLPDQTDVFAVGANGALYVAWVDGAGTWKGPVHIAPQSHPAIILAAVSDGEGRFIAVTGVKFSLNQTVKLGYDIFSGGGPTTHQTGENTLTTDGTGGFLHRIHVNLGQSSGVQAQVQATDVASGAIATASLQ